MTEKTKRIIVQRYVQLTYNPEAICSGCSWRTDPSPITLDLVKGHVAATGHIVDVSRLTVSTYGPKDKL